VEERSGILYFAPHAKSGKMTKASISQQKYLEASQLFHWATIDHFNIWLYGSPERSRRSEVILPLLSRKWDNPDTRKRSLFSTTFGKRKVYTCPRRVTRYTSELGITLKIAHGLGVTECLVRLWRSNMKATVIEERFFYGSKCGSIPDIGLKYPSGKMILVEFTTKSNFERWGNIKNKLSHYRSNLWRIDEKFSSSSIILFVVDIPRDKLQKYLMEITPAGLPVFFVDFDSFTSIPIGEQLSAPIYIWGEDGNSYPLTKNA
jgi:hypothetical protein